MNTRTLLLGIYVSLALIASGCATTQIHSNAKHSAIALLDGDLAREGLAFLIPSTVTGQEEDKQILAMVFTDSLQELRPDIGFVSLARTLSAINNAGIAPDYKQMVSDYRDTGIFTQPTLQRIGEITSSRYVVQLKLASFVQYSQGRFSALGLRLFQTKQAHIRVFLQIWDTRNGSIAWEAMEELNVAHDTSDEEPISFNRVVKQASENLISRLPQ